MRRTSGHSTDHNYPPLHKTLNVQEHFRHRLNSTFCGRQTRSTIKIEKKREKYFVKLTQCISFELKIGRRSERNRVHTAALGDIFSAKITSKKDKRNEYLQVYFWISFMISVIQLHDARCTCTANNFEVLVIFVICRCPNQGESMWNPVSHFFSFLSVH